MTTTEDFPVADQLEAYSLTRTSDQLIFKIVFVYEDFETAYRAIAVSLKLATGLAPEGKVDLRAWRVDLLDDPDLRTEALGDAANADAVIVSSHRTTPKSVDKWLENCLDKERNTGLIVVEIAATDEDWTIAIRHPVEFSGTHAGLSAPLEQTFRCGYRAALAKRRCV